MKKEVAKHPCRQIPGGGRGRSDKVILLASNLASEDAEALVVAEMYCQRWQIELFF